MVLDTVAIGAHVDGLKVGALLDRGWDVYSRTSGAVPGRGDLWACCELGGARLKYLSGIGWLSAEASLPKLLYEDNAVLLQRADFERALALVRDVAGAAAGCAVPPLAEWRVSRFDAVWAWDRDPAAYLGAVGVARLPRTKPVRYESGVQWRTSSGRVRARAYDKRIEQGHTVDLPLRIERQVRPRRERVRIDGAVLGNGVGDLTPAVARAVVSDALGALGLDRPIHSLGATRGLLQEAYGPRTGRSAWDRLRDVIELGGWPGDVGNRTRQRYEALWRAAGVGPVSAEGELPGLAVP